MVFKEFKEGFPYSFDASKCSECGGHCCIGESGYIWINIEEIKALAKHLDMDVNEFANAYLRKVNYKYSLKEIEYQKNKFACIFFDFEKKGCSIYNYRPNQCRTFPFWDYFKKNLNEVYKECIGVEKI